MIAADSAIKELEPGAGNYSLGQSCVRVCVFKCLENYFNFFFAAIRLVKCIEKEIL